MGTVFATAFGLGISLILPIGAQNTFVLRQGLMRSHVLPVLLTCAVSDAILITLGVFGFETIANLLPSISVVMRWAGAIFLFLYGMMSFRSAWRGGQRMIVDGREKQPLAGVLLTCFALTWLNPHVYLDTVALIGAVALNYRDALWMFWAGAVTASFVFFFALGYGARILAPLFKRPSAWRILDIVIGLVMWSIALGLLRSLQSI